jgi:hypothetical protein
MDERGSHGDFLALILPGRWSEVLPQVIPPITENRSSDVGYRFGALSIPAHACLVDAGTWKLPPKHVPLEAVFIVDLCQCLNSTFGKGAATSHRFTNGTNLTSVLPRSGDHAYHWRVRAINRDQGANSAIHSFTVVQPKNALTHAHRDLAADQADCRR